VPVDAQRPPWVTRAEEAIRALRGVSEARVEVDGEDVSEIHVLSQPGRPPKQIVRDVQTLFRTLFNRGIDHRVVSIVANPVPARAPAESAAAPARAEEPEPAAAERIRFGGVNLYVAGPRAEAQVELRWKGLSRMGSAAGSATRDAAHTLIAAATLAAVQEFLEDDWALSLQGIESIRLGRREAVVVGLALIGHRVEKSLVGSCTVEQDAQQAVVLATLAALNRVVGGLRTREPVEYVLRPASD
jgi:hypothetical protein